MHLQAGGALQHRKEPFCKPYSSFLPQPFFLRQTRMVKGEKGEKENGSQRKEDDDSQWTSDSSWSSSDTWKPDNEEDPYKVEKSQDSHFQDVNIDEDEENTKENVKRGKEGEVSAATKLQLSPATLCTIVGISNVVQGCAVGCVFGGVSAVFEGASQGALRQPGFPQYARQASWKNGKLFGGWLGVYSGSKCALRTVRGKDDIFTNFVAGFLAGSVGVLKTRHPPTILLNGLSSGVLMGVMNAFSLINF